MARRLKHKDGVNDMIRDPRCQKEEILTGREITGMLTGYLNSYPDYCTIAVNGYGNLLHAGESTFNSYPTVFLKNLEK